MSRPSREAGPEPDQWSRAYALLLRAYSSRFRRMYAEGMLEAFRIRRAEAERGGRMKLAAWACLAVADILWNAPQERMSTWRDARRGDPAFRGGAPDRLASGHAEPSPPRRVASHLAHRGCLAAGTLS